jgi:hypothetical protein
MLCCAAGPYITALYPKSPNPKALARAIGASTGGPNTLFRIDVSALLAWYCWHARCRLSQFICQTVGALDIDRQDEVWMLRGAELKSWHGLWVQALVGVLLGMQCCDCPVI